MKYLLFILFILVSVFCDAQDYLVLEKMGTKKRYEYFPNDQITFRVSGEDFYRKDYILALSDTSLIFANGVVTISEIERVKLPVTSWMAVTGGTLVVAGVGYYLIDTFNEVIISGNKYSNDSGVLRTSIIITGIGASLIVFSTKKVKFTKNWRLRIVEIY